MSRFELKYPVRCPFAEACFGRRAQAATVALSVCTLRKNQEQFNRRARSKSAASEWQGKRRKDFGADRSRTEPREAGPTRRDEARSLRRPLSYEPLFW